MKGIRDLTPKINLLLSKPDIKRIIGNIFSLSILNGINYLFPLMLIPYLVRVLGVEKYGLYVFSFVVIQYFVLLVNYGFPFSGTKLISIYRNNKIRVSVIFYNIVFARILFAIIATVIILLIILIFPKFRSEYVLYLYGLGILFGSALNPIWFFQGIEKMKYLTVVNFLSKLTTVLLVFILIKTKDDYIYVNLFFSIGYILAGIVSLVMAIKVFKIGFIRPKLKHTLYLIKNGLQVFLSTLGMNLYRDLNTIILGIMFDYSVVGFYAAAEKVVKVIQSLLSPVSQALFPYFGKEINSSLSDKEKGIKNLNRIGLFFLAGLVLILIGFLIISKSLTILYLGIEFLPSLQNMRIMSLVIVFGSLNYFFGIIGLVNLGYQKQFTKFVFTAGIISLILSVSLSYFFKDFGASLTMSIVELLLFLMIFKFYNEKTKLYNVKN